MASYNFNDDLLMEIFSRAELKTMRKCRVLSKECKRLTYDSTFMRLHAQRTTTMVGYLLLQNSTKYRFNTTFLSIDNPDLVPKQTLNFLGFLSKQEKVKILATVDEGLVFCVGEIGREARFYICKPSSQQSEIVPAPNLRFFTMKIGMLVLGSNPLQFLIVRLSDSADDVLEHEPDVQDYNYNYKRYHCEIFYSKSWEWKQSRDLMLPYYDLFNNKPAVSACGALHWLTSNNVDEQNNNSNILSFYGDEENWRMTPLPDSLFRKYWHSIHLASCEGSLGLICTSKDQNFLEIWVSTDQQVWIRKHRVNLKLFNEIDHIHVDSFYNADTLFVVGLQGVIFYNIKTGKFKRVHLHHKWLESAYFVQTDSELVELKPQKEKFRWSVVPNFVLFCFSLYLAIRSVSKLSRFIKTR